MELVYGQIKQIKSENHFIKFDRCHKINSNVDVEKQNLARSIIATEEKYRQFNWCFAIYSNHQPRRNILLKATLCKCVERWLTHAHPIPL